MAMARAIRECNSKLLMLSEVSYNIQDGQSVDLSFDHGSQISSSLLGLPASLPLIGRVTTNDHASCTFQEETIITVWARS